MSRGRRHSGRDESTSKSWRGWSASIPLSVDGCICMCISFVLSSTDEGCAFSFCKASCILSCNDGACILSCNDGACTSPFKDITFTLSFKDNPWHSSLTNRVTTPSVSTLKQDKKSNATNGPGHGKDSEHRFQNRSEFARLLQGRRKEKSPAHQSSRFSPAETWK